MSFNSVLARARETAFEAFFQGVSDADVTRIIGKPSLDPLDLLALLSPRAAAHLEDMAQKAQNLTVQNFGKVVQIYTPIYLGNFCDNECLYCSFRRTNVIDRRRLSLAEVEREAEAVSRAQIRHVLLLTGGSRRETPVSYLRECVSLLRKYFTSISIEVYSLETEEYRELIAAGVDGLTIYQETYDRTLYGRLHPSGPKKDFAYRLDAPERAAAAHMRCVNIGALLGLAEGRIEAFFLGLHAAFLQDSYPEVEMGISLPRFQPAVTDFTPASRIGDREFVQLMTALRLFLPRVGITISTREGRALRSHLIGLGVTRMSAGSRTEVGGYALDQKTQGQFEVADTSDVDEVKKMIVERGYQPVLKDWQFV